MKTIIVCLLAVVAMAYARANGGQYTDRYDSTNLDEIIKNHRLLIPYIKCVLEVGKCTAEGKELRSHIREALEQNCAKCTQAQKDGTRRVIGHIINTEPDYWNQLKAKYDSTGKYSYKYEQELRQVKA